MFLSAYWKYTQCKTYSLYFLYQYLDSIYLATEYDIPYFFYKGLLKSYLHRKVIYDLKLIHEHFAKACDPRYLFLEQYLTWLTHFSLQKSQRICKTIMYKVLSEKSLKEPCLVCTNPPSKCIFCFKFSQDKFPCRDTNPYWCMRLWQPTFSWLKTEKS